MVLYFGDEVVARLSIRDDWGMGLTELPQKRNPIDGKPRWLRGSLITQSQKEEEKFQEDNGIA